MKSGFITLVAIGLFSWNGARFFGQILPFGQALSAIRALPSPSSMIAQVELGPGSPDVDVFDPRSEMILESLSMSQAFQLLDSLEHKAPCLSENAAWNRWKSLKPYMMDRTVGMELHYYPADPKNGLICFLYNLDNYLLITLSPTEPPR